MSPSPTRRYDAHLAQRVAACGTELVIPIRCNRKVQRLYDADFYQERTRTERFFNKLEQYRHVATRSG